MGVLERATKRVCIRVCVRADAAEHRGDGGGVLRARVRPAPSSAPHFWFCLVSRATDRMRVRSLDGDPFVLSARSPALSSWTTDSFRAGTSLLEAHPTERAVLADRAAALGRAVLESPFLLVRDDGDRSRFVEAVAAAGVPDAVLCQVRCVYCVEGWMALRVLCRPPGDAEEESRRNPLSWSSCRRLSWPRRRAAVSR